MRTLGRGRGKERFSYIHSESFYLFSFFKFTFLTICWNRVELCPNIVLHIGTDAVSTCIRRLLVTYESHLESSVMGVLMSGKSDKTIGPSSVRITLQYFSGTQISVVLGPLVYLHTFSKLVTNHSSYLVSVTGLVSTPKNLLWGEQLPQLFKRFTFTSSTCYHVFAFKNFLILLLLLYTFFIYFLVFDFFIPFPQSLMFCNHQFVLYIFGSFYVF